ncbi:hypothetical protein PGT21_013948 [Puccinia graminis f. sp. tritici]|uniref:Uncharacterized protein n=1 Tax=Puccinia graminis f. sp. tritici TaxID=56615 RepID=A0A5B0NL47_PUCGR|nr:hypothetical protein PGT21_013948 [Puccinia graminis f. sp. tritici]
MYSSTVHARSGSTTTGREFEREPDSVRPCSTLFDPVRPARGWRHDGGAHDHAKPPATQHLCYIVLLALH